MKNFMTIITFSLLLVTTSFISSCEPEGLTPISEFAENENVIIFQRHTQGEGIQLVLVADGYQDETISTLYQMYKLFFEVEPYPALKDYFTVIGVTQVDSLGITTYQDRYTGNISNLYTKIQVAAGLKSLHNTAIVIAVSPELPYKRSCAWMLNNHHKESITLCAFAHLNDEYRKYILGHELGGHCLGGLEDEYIEYQGEIPSHAVASLLKWQKQGMLQNVSLTAELPEEWKQLQNVFGENAVTLYEGGALYSEGVYRSSKNSIMRHQSTSFNTVSEFLIWKGIIEYKAGQKTNVQEFIEYKKQSRALSPDDYSTATVIPDSLHGRVIRLTE